MKSKPNLRHPLALPQLLNVRSGASAMNRSCFAGIALLGLAVSASVARAQDPNDMMKWVMAEVIHYDVVAAYSGDAVIMTSDGDPPVRYSTRVTDRFEMGFDWNPSTMSLVGVPTFRNFPSALPDGTPGFISMGIQCPGPKVNSPYDHFEVTGATAGAMGSNSLELSLTRTYAAGSVAFANEYGCENWAETSDTSDVVTHGIFVPPGMYLAMPKETLAANITVSGPDAIVIEDEKTGWQYTYSLKVKK